MHAECFAIKYSLLGKKFGVVFSLTSVTWCFGSDSYLLSYSCAVHSTTTPRTWTRRTSTARWRVSPRPFRTSAFAAKRTWMSRSNGAREMRSVFTFFGPFLACGHGVMDKVYLSMHSQMWAVFGFFFWFVQQKALRPTIPAANTMKWA